jgi:hypothetical protein
MMAPPSRRSYTVLKFVLQWLSPKSRKYLLSLDHPEPGQSDVHVGGNQIVPVLSDAGEIDAEATAKKTWEQASREARLPIAMRDEFLETQRQASRAADHFEE